MKKIVLLLCCYLSVILYTHAQSTDCGIDWEPTVQLSSNAGGFGPRVATQGDTIHVVYFGSYRLPYVRSTNAGQNWEPIRDLIADTIMFPSRNIRPLISSNDSLLYVIFNGGIDGTGDSPLFLMRSTNRGNTWTNPIALTSMNAYPRDITVFGDTVIITANINLMEYETLLLSTNCGETWNSRQLTFYVNDPRVVLSQGWTHIAYGSFIEGCSFEQMYRRSSDLGQTWGDSVVLSTCDNRGGGTPSIAATPDGNIFVSWTDAKFGCMGIFGCSILFRRSTNNGFSWLNEETLTNTPWGDVSELISSNGFLFAAWSAGGGTESRLSTNMGAVWTNVCTVIDTGGRPRIGLLSENVFVAWERSTGGIFKAHGRSGTLPVVSVAGPFLQPTPFFKLYEPFPNPFNANANFMYEVAVSASVDLRLYDVLGQEVAVLIQEKKDPGRYTAQWNAETHSSGVYFYRFTVGGRSTVGKIALLR